MKKITIVCLFASSAALVGCSTADMNAVLNGVNQGLQSSGYGTSSASTSQNSNRSTNTPASTYTPPPATTNSSPTATSQRQSNNCPGQKEHNATVARTGVGVIAESCF